MKPGRLPAAAFLSTALVLAAPLLGFATPARAPAPLAEWNFLVYLNADNDLEAWFGGDIAMMAQLGSTSDVNILVQVDRIPGFGTDHGDWTDTRRFYVTQGLTPDPGNELANLGEVNMGAGLMATPGDGSLEDFIRWAGINYPAQRTCLVFWDHGTGWRGSTPPRAMKSCGWDWTSQDRLEMQEVRLALEGCAADGLCVDLISFDACLMAMLEVAWELRGVTGVMIGSEDVMSTGTYPYDDILTDLLFDPTAGPTALAGFIVDRYSQIPGHGTMSAIDLTQIDPLAFAAHRLACALTTDRAAVIAARGEVKDYGYGPPGVFDAVDLYHFAELLAQNVPSGAIHDAAVEVMGSFQCVMHNVGPTGHDHGLAIYLAKKKKNVDEDYNGGEVLFARDTLWDAFVRWYWELPWLECRGVPRPGDTVEIRVCGQAAAAAMIFASLAVQQPPHATPYGDFHLLPPMRQHSAGTLNGDGVLFISTRIPAFWAPGNVKYLQALVGPFGGAETVLTNLMTLEIE